MVESDLYTPLQAPSRRHRRRGPKKIVVYGAALMAMGVACFSALYDDGHHGEPFAVGSIDLAAAKAPREASPGNAPQSATLATPPLDPVMEANSKAGREVTMENGVMVIRATGSSTAAPISLTVSDPVTRRASLALPDAQLMESSTAGPLPRIGRDGRKPASFYAGAEVSTNGKPRIAFVLGGMGLDRAATSEANAQLPAAVTFGFAPYGPRLAEQVAQTRAAGHEVILQMPMEDFGRDERPFPHMLKSETSDNGDRLHWLLSRFAGYAGVGNYLGGRLLADEGSLRPLLQEVAARGLYFIDDGTAPRSLAVSLARELALPAAKTDVVIDVQADAASVTAAMMRLEKIAHERGFALGSATGRAATTAAIGRYLADAVKRGIVVVPVSQALSQTVPASGSKSADAAAR